MRGILLPYLTYNTPQKCRFLPCRVTAVLYNIYFEPAKLCWVGEINPFRVIVGHEQ